MKKIKWICMLLTALVLGACGEDDLNPNSIFDTEDTGVQNEFDSWLLTNYAAPFNINFKYHLEDKETDMKYNLAPADYDKSVALAKMVKFLWLDAYEELAGPDFIRTYCPKMIQLVGSPAYNSKGEIVLGTAEGGLKITLYNVNSIDLDNIDIDELNYWYFKTMHHEFAHILHQTKEYSTDFGIISASNYQSSSWVNVEEVMHPQLGKISTDALDMGFVSSYGSSEPQEDFVEFISIYVTHTAAYWDALVSLANDYGRDVIEQKLAIVKDYMKTTWEIDLDELRAVVQRRSQEVLDMDLSTLN